jgi:hypothetical protein
MPVDLCGDGATIHRFTIGEVLVMKIETDIRPSLSLDEPGDPLYLLWEPAVKCASRNGEEADDGDGDADDEEEWDDDFDDGEDDDESDLDEEDGEDEDDFEWDEVGDDDEEEDGEEACGDDESRSGEGL